MHALTAVLLFCFVCFGECGSSEGDLCSQLFDMGRYCTAQRTNGQSPYGRVGKAGPRGPPGERGQPGIVDYNRVSAMVSDKLQGFKSLQREVEQLEELVSWYTALNGHLYKVFKTKVSYATAKARCRQNGAILASVGVRDPAIREDLVKMMKFKNHDVWIGADDIQNEGTFVWDDGVVSSGNDVEFYDRQPDNSGGVEDCLHYRPSYNWKVNDDPCARPKMYLCEKLN